ncbi:MAG: hypothetical protein JXN63_08890 [Candidatus Delongbacteria bacterium]|nr:hypothetical protein [Candidatus Delongbacteria bacterium]
MRKKSVQIFLLFFLASLFSQIQVHRHLTTEDGLVQSDICAIHQDINGYVWFATMGGISRWDGVEFLNFHTSNGLPAAQIYDIFEDLDGKLYFPTYGGGSVVYENGNMTKAFKEIDKYDIELAAIEKDENGNYYFGGYDGICMLDKSNTAVYLDSTNSVWNISKGIDGSLYFGTYKVGVRILKDNKWKELNTETGLADNAVWKVLEDKLGNLHIGTNQGLSIFKDMKPQKINSNNEFFKSRITAIFESKSNLIYYGGIKGVAYYLNDKWSFLTKENGLTATDVWSIYEDSYGQIYFGSAGGGVSIYRPNIFKNFTVENGLSDNIVQSIYEDENGVFYFGTENGVSVLKNGKFSYITSEDGLTGNKIRKITGNGKGQIFIGTLSGLNILSENNEIMKLTSEDGLIDDQIFSLYYSKNGSLYVCTKKGVSVLKDGKFINYSKEDGMQDEYVQFAFENSQGEIEFGTYLGVVIKDGDNFSSISTNDGLSGLKIISIYEDKSGRKYYGTYGKGLNIFHKGKVNNLSIKDGLSGNTIGSIQEDNSGNIYIATGQGIDVLTFVGDSINIRNIDQKDGLISDDNLRDASYKDSKGRLWFGTVKGVSCYDPKADKKVAKPPKMHLNTVRLFEDEIVPDENEFAFDQNFLTFEYIGIYLPSPEKVVYKLRLAGLDDKWEYAKERKIRYTGLNPGKYIFEVMAMSEWGYWSDKLSYGFTILPPWYETWWFRTVLGILVLLFLWIIYKARVDKILQVERLRTKIASDLHDEIGSSLTSIFMGTEMIRRSKDTDKINQTAKKIGSSTKELMNTFSDIVWSIESGNDTLGELSDRIEEFVFKMNSDCSIGINYRSVGIKKDTKISSEIRQNIYMIFKEALNNSIKYSDAENISVSLEFNGSELELKVKDNGTGFSSKKQSQGGHGMKSMKFRAEKIGGVMKIVEENGVAIEVKVRI